MKRPTGWPANPQVMATVRRKVSDGHPDLVQDADGDTWLTPRYVLGQLGHFDLDPCAAEQNPSWVGADRIFTVADDGLRRGWFGRVFMNPPFSNTEPWLRRHAQHGNGISLVPASVDSRVWRQVVWKQALAILLLHGRMRFCNPDGSNTTGRPLRSVALIAWHRDDVLMLEESTLAGVLLEIWQQR